MEEHEAGGRRSHEGGDVGGGELVDAFEIPDGISNNRTIKRGCCEGG